MTTDDNGDRGKRARGDYRPGETLSPIFSLDEAWLHTLDQCVGDRPINEVILPLMRDCFFGGAMHAVLLLRRGRGEQLTADIARFITEEPQLPRKSARPR